MRRERKRDNVFYSEKRGLNYDIRFCTERKRFKGGDKSLREEKNV